MSDTTWRGGMGMSGGRGWPVWAAVAAVVATANLMTGGEALTARAGQAEALYDGAVRLLRCHAGRWTRGVAEEVAEVPVQPVEAVEERCHRTVRIRRAGEGAPVRVRIRRRWSCRV
jgi:hypothetical protein